jgi:hypothetical protein
MQHWAAVIPDQPDLPSLATQVLLGLQARETDIQDQAALDKQVMQVAQDVKVIVVTAYRATLVVEVLMVNWAMLVQEDQQAVHQHPPDSRAVWAQDSQAVWAWEYRAAPDWDTQVAEDRDLLVVPAQRQDLLVARVLLVFRAAWATQDRLVSMDQQVIQEQQEPLQLVQDIQVVRAAEQLDLLDLLV